MTDVIASRREIAVWDTVASPVPVELDGLWAAEDVRRATALSCYMRIAAVLGEAVAAGILARGLGRELKRLVRDRLAEG
ncbi:hypothetical protein [Sphingomonas faeni]|uniref:hypothetical protein n=1 Tax=Sphingomonas faeni TaxID=185950 RepID=UPI00334E8018